MEENNNIDRLFQEKFKDFDVAPKEAVWNRIQESLPVKKKKRRVIALWWQLGGVAAAIVVLLTVGVSVFKSDDESTKEFPIVNTDSSKNKLEQQKSNTTSKNQDELNTAKNKENTLVDSDLDADLNSTNDSKHKNNKSHPSSNESIGSKNSKNKSAAIASTTTNRGIKSNKISQNSSTVTDNSIAKLASKNNTPHTNINANNKAQLVSEADRKTAIKNIITENTIVNTEPSTSQELDTTNVEVPIKDTLENAIAKRNESINEDEKEEEQSRWSVAPNVAPVYFNSFGQGSSLDKQFNNNTKGGEVSMSYGISGGYAISKKLKIRTGVNRVHLNQTTADVYAFTGAGPSARGAEASFNNISFRTELQHISLISSKFMDKSTTPELFNTKNMGEIEQRFGFIELPVELEYRLLNTKFGINLIGGFSTFFLNENEVYAEIDGSTTLIGEANNINETSFSANLGLGMDYNLSKQWRINFEPTLKYQINTFNNTTGDFKPFFIGVYTGLNYKF